MKNWDEIKKTKCVFCKNFDEYYDLYKNKDIAWKVALVIHTKGSGGEYRGRTTDYNVRGIGYKLKYCPECGRKLEV